MDVLFLLLGVIPWSPVGILSISALTEGSYSGTTNDKYRCGIQQRKDLPLNHDHGQPVEPGRWPWIANLYYNNGFVCGGSLIDRRHVLTAAFCVTLWNEKEYDVMDSNSISIHLGAYELYGRLESLRNPLQITNVSQIIVHPEYRQGSYDIALLILSEPIRYSEYVIPICIEGIQRNQDLIGQVGSIAGFNSFKNQLKTVSITVRNTTECAQDNRSQFEHNATSATFCALFNKATSCSVIGGSGLYIFFGDHWELRGIQSFYSLFTNVAYHFKWIHNEIGFDQRSSELMCRRYGKFARKFSRGPCLNKGSPHTVAIVDQKLRHICSGSIISEKFVLTKAPNLIDSEFDWDDLWIKQPHTKITKQIYHPQYDPETLRYDVMLLELASPLSFSHHLLPICLANPDSVQIDPLSLIGYTNMGFYRSTNHRIVSIEKCKSAVKQSHRKLNIYSEDICAEHFYDNAFESSTAGIAGGSLQTFNYDSCLFSQIGVFKGLTISPKSKQNESQMAIGVYSRVTAYLDWIEQIVWGY